MATDQVMAQFDALSPTDQAEVRKQLAGLDPGRIPAKEVAGIWRIVLITLGIIGVGALAGGIALVAGGKSAEPLWPFVTLIIGGLVGLIAPSPVST